MKKNVSAGLVGACLWGVLATLFTGSALGQLADSPWPDYGGGSENRHLSTYVGPGGTNVRILWKYQLPLNEPGNWNFSHAQPVITQDGTIVFCTYGDDASTLVALNPDGTERWHVQESALGRWPAADCDGNIYHMRCSNNSGSEALRARKQDNGAILWSYPISGGGYAQTGPTVGPDGTVYGSLDGGGPLYSFTPDGHLNWSRTGSGFMDNPAIAPDGTIITGGTQVRAYSPSGTQLWSYEIVGGVHIPSVSIGQNGVVYASSGYGASVNKVVALDSEGHKLWEYDGASGAPAVGPDGTIYAGFKGTLHAINPDGTGRWTYSTGQIDEFGAEGVTVDRVGNVYLATVQGFVMSLDADGQRRWSLDLAPDYAGGVWPSAPIIGGDGLLYVGGGYTAEFYALVPEPAALGLLALGGLALLRPKRASECKR